MQILFYHLEMRPLEQVLPILLEKTLENGWKAIVETSDLEKAKRLDEILWKYKDESFLAHAISGGKHDESQPILLTTKDDNLNSANVRFFVDGKAPKTEEEYVNDYANNYDRLVFLFDGHDQEKVEYARQVWKNLKENHDLAYWQQDGAGQWIKKA